MNERLQRDAAAHEQGADTFGRIELVPCNGKQIDAEPIHVSCNLANRLSSVGMEKDAMLTGDACALLNRLDRAHLVVGVHDADEDRARRDRPAQVVGIAAPESIHGQVSYPRAEAFKKTARLDDRWVLDPGSDDVIATAAPGEVCAFERKIVGLASAAGEDDFVILTAEQSSDLPARFFKGGFGGRGGPMTAGGVAEIIRKKRLHRCGNRWIDGCACVVIEVDAPHVQDTRAFWMARSTAGSVKSS